MILRFSVVTKIIFFIRKQTGRNTCINLKHKIILKNFMKNFTLIVSTPNQLTEMELYFLEYVSLVSNRIYISQKKERDKKLEEENTLN